MKPFSTSRRAFIGGSIGAGISVPNVVLGLGERTLPSNRITVGLIGCGGRGVSVLNSFLSQEDVQVVAVCDAYKQHHRGQGSGKAFGSGPASELVGRRYRSKPCDVYSDYRELCSRGDLDAVIVATPDHWHAVQSMEALRHGKDIYCEKPVTHFFAEGRQLHQEVTRRGAVFQTGSQQRSNRVFRKAVNLVRNGVIGSIKEVQVGLPGGPNMIGGDADLIDRSDDADYGMWTGPAPMLPYCHARHHRLWRWHLAYGGGQLMDWIGHHNDICHWGLGEDLGGPVRVEARNFRATSIDVYSAPVAYEVHCDYANGVRTSLGTHNRGGTTFLGENGWVHVNRGRLETSDPKWLAPTFNPGSFRAYYSDNHTRNFIDCVKSRKQTICSAEVSHRSITPGHLGYVSQAVGRPLRWNPTNETIVGDQQAQAHLNTVHHRGPWTMG